MLLVLVSTPARPKLLFTICLGGDFKAQMALVRTFANILHRLLYLKYVLLLLLLLLLLLFSIGRSLCFTLSIGLAQRRNNNEVIGNNNFCLEYLRHNFFFSPNARSVTIKCSRDKRVVITLASHLRGYGLILRSFG